MTGTHDTELELPVPADVGKQVNESLLSRFLGLLCSVRLGVILLITLGAACFIGMVVMQQNVDGFDVYYARLTPAQRLLYGNLGLFDIYHAWYFNALLIVLSLNIILASVDRFPRTWRIATKPNITIPIRWLQDQSDSQTFEVNGAKDAVLKVLPNALLRAGFRNIKTAGKNGSTFVFGESGVWNRFGAYAVHVGLLTIFAGGFLTAQFGHTGQLSLSPGKSADKIDELVFELDQMQQGERALPFSVLCTDIQQKLIRKDGSIAAGNTIDWITRIQITDKTGKTEALVHMNTPFDYGGYRFFQSSFVSIGRARNILIELRDKNGRTQELALRRDGETTLSDGTKVKFADFRANFSLGQEDPNEDTSEFTNPAAILQITPKNGEPKTAYAIGGRNAQVPIVEESVAGFTFRLKDFEKVSDQHILSVQRDPGSTVVYIGFAILFISLALVFFFSHKRVWIAVQESAEGSLRLTLGGNTNRNQTALAEKLKKVRGLLSQK